MPTREEKYRDLCIECELPGETQCVRCAGHLCKSHRPAKRSRCSRCELDFDARVMPGELIEVSAGLLMALFFGLYFLWPSWPLLLLVATGVYCAPAIATAVVSSLHRAKFLAERPRRRGPEGEPNDPETDLMPPEPGETQSEETEQTEIDGTPPPEFFGTMEGIAQALVAWVEATTSTGKPTSRAHYGLYDFCHEERFALVATCEKALDGPLHQDVDAPAAKAALATLVESLRDLAAVVFDDGIGCIDAAAVTLECDAEFGATCREVLRLAASAMSALAADKAPKSMRSAAAEQREGFEALERHDPYAALPHFRKAAVAWGKAPVEDLWSQAQAVEKEGGP